MPRKGQDLTGLTFGRLTALGYIHRGSDRFWHCRCECGAERWIVTGSLTSGRTRSCGCLPHRRSGLPRKVSTHGQARKGATTRTFRIWKSMLSRCSNPNGPDFHRYGGRGITVCDEWKKFVKFRHDMGDCPPTMEIDRINNDGNYEPGNCRWATRKEQTRNTSFNRHMTLNGTTKCVSEWSELLGIAQTTLNARLRYGWSDERALTEPVDHSKNPKRVSNRAAD